MMAYTRPLADAAQNAGQTIETAATNTMQYVNQGVDNVRTGFSNTIAPFSNGTEIAGAAKDYLNSNSMIAKFAFVVLILFAFFALVNLGILILGYFMQSPKNPYLIYGMVDGNFAQSISQDPRQNNASIVSRSNNQSTGMEFTWSVWLLVNDTSWIADGNKKFLHVFNKGDVPSGMSSESGIAGINNAPGLYFSTGTGSPNPEMMLHVVMDTVTPTPVTLDVSGIPFHQWFHVAVRLENTLLDVYINGTISGRTQMVNVPKQNYQDVNVSRPPLSGRRRRLLSRADLQDTDPLKERNEQTLRPSPYPGSYRDGARYQRTKIGPGVLLKLYFRKLNYSMR